MAANRLGLAGSALTAAILLTLASLTQTRAQVVGGQPIDISEAPWQVELVVEANGKSEICGGSLIAPRWVLTAAHCFSSPTGHMHTEARLGAADIRSAGPMVTTDRVIIHHAYDKTTLANDIALVRLAAPVSGVAIALAHDDRALIPGAVLEVTGWGAPHEGGNLASNLMRARVPLVANTACNAASSYADQIKPSMLCAGFIQGGVDACQGDSGGPIVLRQSGKPPLLVGIVSFGIGCARPQKFGVYTRVSAFADWIAVKSGVRSAP